jgi:2-polyprenyl-6-hydroxyphenyl methylase/3-demethylubiquinone-9 3-methyltransferase
MNTTISTIDPAEAERFNALASTWWQPDGPMWPLHRLNALRVPYVVEHLGDHLNRDTRRADCLDGLRVLDIGCGAGLLSEALARRGAVVTGIDIAERNVAIARQHAEVAGLAIDYRLAAAETLADAPFDVVMNMEVVEHVANLPAFMTHASRLTRPGGVMFVATLNRTLRAFLTAIIGAEYVLGWLPRGTHRWRKFVKPEEIIALLEASGLRAVDRTGVRVNPLTRGYSLSRDLGINYMVTAVREAA